MKRLQRSAAVTFAVLSWFSLSACETTSMSAKSGPDELSQREPNACERKQNRRSECDDEVGCFWDSAANRCAAH